MASSKRERELARRRLERQAARRAAQRAQRRRRAAIAGSVAAVLVVIAAVVVLATGAGNEARPAAAPTPAPADTPRGSPGASPSGSSSGSPDASPSTPASASAASGPCAYGPARQPASRNVGSPPTADVDRSPRTATIKLNTGAVTVALLADKAPCTVNSFTYLAAKDYFTKTPCHRLTTSGIFVLQCGDPSGTGSGGPGYEFGDENLPGASYPAGTVAMANAGPGTNGSQFFLVYQDTKLPPNYTPFGRITAGLDVVQAVAKAGTKDGSSDEAPKDPVTIESVAVAKST